MSTHILLPDNNPVIFKDKLLKKLSGLREKIKIIESECKEAEILICQLDTNQNLYFQPERSTVIDPLADSMGYKETWTWEDKIKFIMKYKENIGLTTSQIVSNLQKFEPRFKLDKDRAKAVSCVSAILSAKFKEGVFYKKNNERNKNVYYMYLNPFE